MISSHRYFLLLATALIMMALQQGRSDAATYVPLQPISQRAYDSIMELIAGKQPVAEGRLISNDRFKSLSDWSSSLTQDITSGWKNILNFTGVWSTEEKPTEAKVEGYPLCVIKTTDWQPTDEAESTERKPRQAADEDPEEPTDYPYPYPYYPYYPHYPHFPHYPPRPEEEPADPRPVINCIVVLKPTNPNGGTDSSPDEQPDDTHNGHTHYGGGRPRPGHYGGRYRPYPIPPYAYYPHYQKRNLRTAPESLQRKGLPERIEYPHYPLPVVSAESTRRVEKTKPRAEDDLARRNDYARLYYEQLLKNYPVHPPPLPSTYRLKQNSASDVDHLLPAPIYDPRLFPMPLGVAGPYGLYNPLADASRLQASNESKEKVDGHKESP